MPPYMKVLRLVKGVTRTDRVCNANIYESAEIGKGSNQNRQGMQCHHIWVIPCQMVLFLAIFALTPSDFFYIWHICRYCLETNTHQI